MSTCWEVLVKVDDYAADKQKEIEQVLCDEIDIENEDLIAGTTRIVVSSIGSYGNKFDAAEFGKRLTQLIWDANGAFCTVYVGCLCRENLPWDDTNLDEEQYNEYKAKS